MLMYQKMLDIVKSYEDQMITLLADMVKIPSVSGDEAKLAEFICGYCDSLGFESSIDRHGNVLVLVQGQMRG